jgi:carbonic anhydrase
MHIRSPRRRILAIASPVLLALLVGACVGAPPQPSPTAAPVHWTYEGEEGPQHWGELSPDYEACAVGMEQSPIDIEEVTEQELPDISFDYSPAQLEILNNGHTVQVNYPPGSGIELEGTRHELLQFHFHTPSEHRVAGRQADAELHLVHRSAAGALAVVGVLLNEGDENPALAPVWDNLPAQPGPAQTFEQQVDAEALLPASRTTFRYPGSLTTPPCSEGVSWLLMTDPITLSSAQLAELTAIIEGNNRPVQPLNERTVLEDLD